MGGGLGMRNKESGSEQQRKILGYAISPYRSMLTNPLFTRCRIDLFFNYILWLLLWDSSKAKALICGLQKKEKKMIAAANIQPSKRGYVNRE